MTFDHGAAEQLAGEAAEAMQEVARRFTKGLQELVQQAAAEAARERQRLQEESTALARERQRLEEAWQHLNVERARIEAGPVSSGHKPSLYPSPRESVEEATLTRSPGGPGAILQGPIPSNYIVSVGDRAYTVLPLKEPEAMSLGHELWNHVVEVPEGWEVLSTQMENFHQVLGQHRWGAMVLGVRNAKRGFDAYWTPLFGDGSFAAQLCEADVDWIEPAGQEAPQQELKRFRMTYSGLRLVIRKAHGMMTSVKHVASGALSTPRMAGPMQVHHFAPGVAGVYNGAGYRSPMPTNGPVTILPQMFRPA